MRNLDACPFWPGAGTIALVQTYTMQHLHLHKRFINQFRFNHIIYPCREEKQYRQFRFRQFAGPKNEIKGIGKFFVRNMTEKALIVRIINQLESDYTTNYILLQRYTQNFAKQLSAQIRKGPGTSTCCSRLLSVIQPFLLLINSFHEKAQNELLENLKSIAANKKRPVDTTSDDVNDIMLLTGRFSDTLVDYCETFDSFLYNESQNTCDVAVTTYIGQYLLQLANLLERLFSSITSAQRLLNSWKVQLAYRENQELYN